MEEKTTQTADLCSIDTTEDTLSNTKTDISARILSVSELLAIDNLVIPDYQRPYKWAKKNVAELLSDIKKATYKKECVENFKYKIGSIDLHKAKNLDIKKTTYIKRATKDFKYRIGSIILHKTKAENEDVYAVVDGQQRVITFTILITALKKLYPELSRNLHLSESLSKHKFKNTEKDSVKTNYETITNFLNNLTDNEKINFIKSLTDVLQVVVIFVKKQTEAFQLFDSQNYRGKPLAPHDLLKAYHLRTMTSKSDANTTQTLVSEWEKLDSNSLHCLFNDYLFPIITFSEKKKWDIKHNRQPFTKSDIDTFYGIEKNKDYPYSLHIYSLHETKNPFFVINEPFAEGESFFKMTNFYIEQIAYLDILLDDEPIVNISKEKQTSFKDNLKGLKDTCRLIKNFYIKEVACDANGYAYKLFKQAILFYFNRFSRLDVESLEEKRNIDSKIIKKLFVWAMMIRVEMTRLSLQTIKKYAIGEGNYINNIPLFYMIANAKNTDELLNLAINFNGVVQHESLPGKLKALLNDKYTIQDGGDVKNDQTQN